MQNIRAASVQFQHRSGDTGWNFDRVRNFTLMAADKGVDLIVFPEMCLTGYWHVRNLDRGEIEDLAEPVPDGLLCRKLLALASETGITIGAGLIETDGEGRLFNSYFVAMPDGSHACHRKLHTFISEHMESGSDYTVFDDEAHGCRLGVLTCYDNNIGENARITALMGAEILLAPHQTGGCETPSPRCMGLVDPMLWENREADPGSIEAEFRGPKGREWLLRWLPSRAHDNGMFLIFSNGVGPDDGEVRTGNTMILDPYGEILAETWAARDEMVIADLEASRLENCTGRRWIQTRRPDRYHALCVPTGGEADTRTVRFAGKGNER
ncbi:MAG: acyltransferase [Verrucomicrobiales bacterium]|nr:acyltransferase [Verrucomicrobiales bacterium]